MVGEVTCLLDNADLKLLPNTNVSVAVVLARHENALTVPREAVRQDAEGKYVFQVVNGQLKRRNVETSVSNLTRVEITSGIPGERRAGAGCGQHATAARRYAGEEPDLMTSLLPKIAALLLVALGCAALRRPTLA